MKNQINILVIAILLITVVFTSCKKDDVDNTKPTITVEEPVNEEEFHPGETIHFDAEFADDVELKSFKIDIHINEDGHTHKSSKSETAWDFEETWDFEAGKKNAAVHEDIVIPQDAEHGEYHLGVFCTDKAGNETSVWIEIIIEEEHL